MLVLFFFFESYEMFGFFFASYSQKCTSKTCGRVKTEFSNKPRLDTVLVVWLSNRSGSAPVAAVSFFRQRFSSMCSRYSSSCCMGRFFRSFAQSCEPCAAQKGNTFHRPVSSIVCSGEAAVCQNLPSGPYLHLKRRRRGPGEDSLVSGTTE